MVESKLVELVVAGSSPVGHPTSLKDRFGSRYLGFQLICELRIRCKTLQYTSAPLGIVCLRHQPIAGYPPLILGRLRVFMRLGRFADGHFAEDVDAARHTISY